MDGFTAFLKSPPPIELSPATSVNTFMNNAGGPVCANKPHLRCATRLFRQ
jgi:hypothetical protein